MMQLTLSRRLRFAALATLLLLLGMEIIARALEPRFFPSKRTLPLPAPAAPGSDEFRARVDLLRTTSQNSSLHVDIPLTADEARGWALPPNINIRVQGIGFRVNADGMRGQALSALEPGEVRLLTLGDSSIFGDSVREEEVFSSVAASLLSQGWRRKVVGVIGAVPGHDTTQSLKTLELVGEKVHPAWVIIGNLWSDVYRYDGAHSILDDLSYLPPLKQRLRSLATYRILWQVMSPWLESQRVRWIQSKEDIGTLDGKKRARVPLEEYIDNLRLLCERSKALGARVAFLMLPAPMDFDKVPPPVTVQAYRKAMRSVAEEYHAPFVDGPAVFAGAKVGLTSFLDHVHPSPEGHRILGQAMAGVLMNVGPPPQGASQYSPPPQ